MNRYSHNLTLFITLATTLLAVYRLGTYRPILESTSTDTLPISELHNGRHLEDAPLDKTLDKIEAKDAIALAQGVLNLIRHRYELDGIGSQFFLTANNIGPHAWDVIKYKFAKKILDKDKYLMIFGGSSVTASHDNYYNQSYPAVVNRRLGPILKSLGVELLVHNIAQGAQEDSMQQIIDWTQQNAYDCVSNLTCKHS